MGLFAGGGRMERTSCDGRSSGFAGMTAFQAPPGRVNGGGCTHHQPLHHLRFTLQLLQLISGLLWQHQAKADA